MIIPISVYCDLSGDGPLFASIENLDGIARHVWTQELNLPRQETRGYEILRAMDLFHSSKDCEDFLQVLYAEAFTQGMSYERSRICVSSVN